MKLLTLLIELFGIGLIGYNTYISVNLTAKIVNVFFLVILLSLLFITCSTIRKAK